MAVRCSCFVAAFIYLILINIYFAKAQEMKTFTVRMPDIKPNYTDTHICRAFKVDSTKEYYISAFEALADKETAHHLLAVGCGEPGSTEEYWDCRRIKRKTKHFPICKSNYELLYLWANNAGKFEMPKDVGYMIGGKSKIQYIVLQVHYVSVERFAKEGVTDNSGLKITYSDVPTPKVASIFSASVGGRILANSTEFFEGTCVIKNEAPIYPFAYRVHTHALGRVVSGYKAVKGKDMLSEKWTLIGKKDPQLPQAFYPVDNEVEIKNGDYLMIRCTFVNEGNTTVRTGARAENEMCVFYMMYWTTSRNITAKDYCRSRGPPKGSWRNSGFVFLPDDASTLPLINHVHHAHSFNLMD